MICWAQFTASRDSASLNDIQTSIQTVGSLSKLNLEPAYSPTSNQKSSQKDNDAGSPQQGIVLNSLGPEGMNDLAGIKTWE